MGRVSALRPVANGDNRPIAETTKIAFPTVEGSAHVVREARKDDAARHPTAAHAGTAVY
jgi:hypothetical protein